MKNNKKFIFLGFFISQIFVYLIIFLKKLNLSLLTYINISFYFASILLLLSLTIYTINSGFFDTVVNSFRRIAKLNGKYIENKESEIERPYSEVISFSQLPILIIGLLNGLACGIALFIYYALA